MEKFKKKIVSIEDKLKELKIILPEAKDPLGSYKATKFSGNLLFVSGQVSIDDKGKLITGKIGEKLDVNQGYEAAKSCALGILAQIKKACDNDFTKIKSCVKITGYVNSTSDFIDQPKVINGASDIIVSIFGDKGLHARAAISASSLPLDASVEVEAIFEIN